MYIYIYIYICQFFELHSPNLLANLLEQWTETYTCIKGEALCMHIYMYTYTCVYIYVS